MPWVCWGELRATTVDVNSSGTWLLVMLVFTRGIVSAVVPWLMWRWW